MGAPDACGDATTPCAFDGTSDLNSGTNPTDGTSNFLVQVNAAAGFRTERGVPHSSGDARHRQRGRHERGRLDAGRHRHRGRQSGHQRHQWRVLATEAAVTTPVVANADGTHTVTMLAGTATPYVEIAEMLPLNLAVNQGDTVKFSRPGRSRTYTP